MYYEDMQRANKVAGAIQHATMTLCKAVEVGFLKQFVNDKGSIEWKTFQDCVSEALKVLHKAEGVAARDAEM